MEFLKQQLKTMLVIDLAVTLSVLLTLIRKGYTTPLPYLSRNNSKGEIPQQLSFYNIDRQADKPHTIENCYGPVMKQSFNDIDYAFLGYNILKGYPFAPGRDPGFTLPIFFANYSSPRYTGDCRYSLPHGIFANPVESCTTSFSSTILKNQRDFSDSLSTTAQASGGAWGVSFSANVGYKRAVSTLESGKNLFIVSQANCQYYFTKMDPVSPPSLDLSFIEAVKGLLRGNRNKYMEFFDTYGTHFVTEMELGARYTNQYEMSTVSYNEQKSKNIDAAVQASYSALLSIGGDFSLDSDQRKTVANFLKKVKKISITVGATPASRDAMEWAESVKNNPMPMRYLLNSIENLFTDQYMGYLNIAHDQIRQKIQQYKLGYCSQLYKQGTVNSCQNSIAANPCDSSPCQNGGSCLLLEGGLHECKCDDNHGGSLCEISCSTRIGEKCYWKGGNEPRNWYASELACNKMGGHLANIYSAGEDTALADVVDPSFFLPNGPALTWSGGRKRESGEWRWSSTNERIEYFNWASGQPDNWGETEEDCLVVVHSQGTKWNDCSCELCVAHAVCQYP